MDSCEDLLLFILSMTVLLNQVWCEDGLAVLYGEDRGSSNNGESFCVYNPIHSPLPTSLEEAKFHEVVNLSSFYMCNNSAVVYHLENKVAFVARGNCTFLEKAVVVQKYGAVAVVVVSSTESNLGKNVQVKLFSPNSPHIDWNMVVIWLLATGTVIIGGFWSGIEKHKQYMKKTKIARQRPQSAEEDISDEDADPETFDMNPTAIIVFVILMCVMLISLYFFYDYLVYMVIAMFTMAACTAMYFCVRPLWLLIPCFGDCRIPPNKLPVLRHRPEVRRIILFLVCTGIAVWWAVERNKSYAWVLQDILGVMFCVHMMKTIRLPSLMSCTVLLGLLFVYDIFFVFITPLFTKSGESVMVDVATGGGSKSGEMLPMVLKVPRINHSALTVCQLSYSLLGFGDILVPAYGIGLVITFVALTMMNQGQPALLYLVPCTLLTTFMIGLCRREVHHLWSGKLSNKTSKKVNGNNASSASSSEARESIDHEADDNIPNNGDVSDSEEPLLINN
ncbi:hypothetical protein LSH36_16g12011 [Paralvinella palmiformis]|uniref:PA domain-containing protein n=1 Tax=Paralvinella palmiformis TaxID=53620 RepID=A0AAD9NH99_9ANNE|nr:hypothetical protein LSH36_16g12011 [Paralvinella palmiformis]